MRFATLARALALASLFAASGTQANVLFTTTDSLVATDPTQLGRLSRNGIAQDWTGGEPFPGIVNPAVTYHYRAYVINVGLTPYLQLSVDSTAATTFFSVYQTSYNPLNLMTNWLGDAGSSGNFFGVDTLFFQVTAALNSSVVVVVNESTTNGGIGLPYGLLLEGFIDTMYTDLVPRAVPEPSTLALLFAPFGLVLARRASTRRANAKRAALPA